MTTCFLKSWILLWLWATLRYLLDTWIANALNGEYRKEEKQVFTEIGETSVAFHTANFNASKPYYAYVWNTQYTCC